VIYSIDLGAALSDNGAMTAPETMKPISAMDAATARSIRWVCTDIDDTMTRGGKLVSEAYAALCDLKASGLRVFAVTGRSAGWGEVHLNEWPIDGVIAENGAIAYVPGGSLVAPSAVPNTDADLRRAAELAYQAVPRARPARDNHFRLYDYAVDHAEFVNPPLSAAEVEKIVGVFQAAGCVAKPSSIHVNCWKGTFNKLEAVLALLRNTEGYDDALDRGKVLYVGDALNDEVLFGHFPNASAVANVSLWLDQMTHRPAWVSEAGYGEGFAEIARRVLSLRR